MDLIICRCSYDCECYFIFSKSLHIVNAQFMIIKKLELLASRDAIRRRRVFRELTSWLNCNLGVVNAIYNTSIYSSERGGGKKNKAGDHTHATCRKKIVTFFFSFLSKQHRSRVTFFLAIHCFGIGLCCSYTVCPFAIYRALLGFCWKRDPWL